MTTAPTTMTRDQIEAFLAKPQNIIVAAIESVIIRFTVSGVGASRRQTRRSSGRPTSAIGVKLRK